MEIIYLIIIYIGIILLSYIFSLMIKMIRYIIKRIINSYYAIKLRSIDLKICSLNFDFYEVQYSELMSTFNRINNKISMIKRAFEDEEDIKESISYYIEKDAQYQENKSKGKSHSKQTKYKSYYRRYYKRRY